MCQFPPLSHWAMRSHTPLSAAAALPPAARRPGGASSAAPARTAVVRVVRVLRVVSWVLSAHADMYFPLAGPGVPQGGARLRRTGAVVVLRPVRRRWGCGAVEAAVLRSADEPSGARCTRRREVEREASLNHPTPCHARPVRRYRRYRPFSA